MSNPVLSTRGIFTPAQPQYVAPSQGLNGYAPSAGAPGGYAQPYAYQPAAPGAAQPGYEAPAWQPPAQAVERMTFDDVLQKTAISLGVLFLVAAFAYLFLPDQILYPVGVIGGLCAFIAPVMVARRRTAGPAGNIVYALTEGLLLGAFSKIFESAYPGIVIQGVVGTFAAAAVTLAAYHFGGFRLSSRLAKMVRVGVIAFCGVALVNLVMAFCGVNTGLFPGPTEQVSGLAWVMVLLGIGLAVFSLVDDFQYVEAGVQMGAPREQGWVAAFGLSVTLVWLYINILRVLSYLRH